MTSVKRPNLINHNNDQYYNSDRLKEYDPIFFYGTSGGVRNIIKRKKINKCNFHYATKSEKFGWRSSCHQNKPATKARLLLLKSWVETNIPKMMPDSDVSKEEKCEYPEAPELILLEDSEKFTDIDGNVVDIETRGERNHKGIYFLAKDVSESFNMPKLIDTITRENRGYKKNKHYCFYSPQPVNDGSPVVKQLFITYIGMLKILFSSRTGKADNFIDWATETLFTVQMGSENQKEVLGSKLIGQSVKNVRSVFKTCSKKVPCIYRFSLGTAKTLRKTMNLPEKIKDDYVIIKYGLTEDLDRRSSEHVREYEKIPNVKLGLMDFSYIDPKFLSYAETDIKEFFQTLEIPVIYKKYIELVAINPKHETQIKKQYKFIATEYQGSITELIDQIKDLKNQLVLKDKDLENKDLIISKKDIEIDYEKIKNSLIELKLLNAMKTN